MKTFQIRLQVRLPTWRLCPTWLPNSTWWKTYAKEWEKIVVYPQGSLIFTTRADTTFDSDNLQPAGAAGGPHRVFVSGSPWPVAVLYRDIHTVPEVDPVLLSHLRFGHADCRRIDTFLDKNIATGISLEKGGTLLDVTLRRTVQCASQ